MGLAKIFTNEGNFIGNVELDIIVNEGASATARVTKNPVENGADINDHIIIDPMTFTVTGVVSNAASGFFDIADSAAQLFRNRTNSQAAWDDLLKLQADRIPFTLIQGLRSYDNVVITSLTENQDATTSNALMFTATLTELILVDTISTTGALFDDSNVSDQASPANNGGLKGLGGF